MFTRHLGEPWAGQCSGPWSAGAAGRSCRVRPGAVPPGPAPAGNRLPGSGTATVSMRGDRRRPLGKQFHRRLPAAAPAEARPSPGRLGRLTRPSRPREPIFHAPCSEVRPTLWPAGRNLRLDVVGPCTRSGRECLGGGGPCPMWLCFPSLGQPLSHTWVWPAPGWGCWWVPWVPALFPLPREAFPPHTPCPVQTRGTPRLAGTTGGAQGLHGRRGLCA